MLYEYLASVLERAYIHRDDAEEIKNNTWPGWHEWIRDYMRSESFASEWEKYSSKAYGYGMHREFEKFMNDELNAIRKEKNIK